MLLFWWKFLICLKLGPLSIQSSKVWIVKTLGKTLLFLLFCFLEPFPYFNVMVFSQKLLIRIVYIKSLFILSSGLQSIPGPSPFPVVKAIFGKRAAHFLYQLLFNNIIVILIQGRAGNLSKGIFRNGFINYQTKYWWSPSGRVEPGSNTWSGSLLFC